MSDYRASDISTVKEGMRIMKEICTVHTDTCGSCPLRVKDTEHDISACILCWFPCDWTTDDIEKCFT